MNPPVPTKLPSENRSNPESSASEVSVITRSRETLLAMSFSGSVCTWNSATCSPQIGTFATPVIPSSRARIFQYAIVDRSIRLMVFDRSPIFMTRLVVDSGWSITGGAAHVGSSGVATAMRSFTSWRAWNRSALRWNWSSIELSWLTDFERMMSRPGVPSSDCSSGTVTRLSTSVGLRPSATVWISTRGGANSGNTSTCALWIAK